MHDVESNAIREPQAEAAYIDAGKLGRQATLRLGSGPGSPPAAASASLPR